MAQFEQEVIENCLRNEEIIVKHIPKENPLAGNNPKHVLSEGMADSAVKILTVPMLRSGQLADVLTKNEKAFLEKAMGLQDDALSVYRKENNYWKNFSVRLEKTENHFNMNNPEDYLDNVRSIFRRTNLGKDRLTTILSLLKDLAKTAQNICPVLF